MRNFDLSPLFRSTIGFDSMARLLETALRADENAVGYPPYNIEKTGENAYRITMAVAGFGENDLNVTTQDNTLIVSGKLAKAEEDTKFLYRGIAGRAFERRFEMAEHVRVAGASLENGLLHIDLVKEVPEAMKPRTIKIETAKAKQPTVIDSKAA
ncbi:MAG: Hsp20 family protein [Pseudomonadota bacterium]